MKLAQLTDNRFHAALAKLMAQPLPLRAAFRLKGIKAKVQEEVKKFEEVRQDALERYGSKDADGKLLLNADNTVQFAPENLQAFADELNKLAETEVEVGSLKTSELSDALTITADELSALDGLITE